MNRQLNGCQRIQHLPTETLVEVFKLAIAPKHPCCSPRPVARLWSLAQVCTSWWSIVRGTPSLWSNIEGGDPFYRMALVKSQNSPLWITFNGVTDQRATNAEIFFHALVPERRRWASFTFHVMQAKDAQWITELHGPHLQEVVIYNHSTQRTVDLPFSSSLHRFRALGADIRFLNMAANLSSLVDIRLEMFSNTPSMFEGLVNLVLSSSSIQSLRICPFIEHGYEAVDTWFETVVQSLQEPVFPALRDLFLRYIPPNLCSWLLSSMTQPMKNLVNIQLHLDNPIPRTTALLSYQSDHPLSKAIQNIISNLPRLWMFTSYIGGVIGSVCFDSGNLDGYRTRGQKPGHFKLDIRLNTGEALGLLRGSASTFLGSSSPPVVLHLDARDLAELTEMQIREIAIATPSTVIMHLIRGDPHVVLQCLQNRFASQTPGQWLWPSLNHLVVENIFSHPKMIHELVAMQRTRYLASKVGEAVSPLKIDDAHSNSIDGQGFISRR